MSKVETAGTVDRILIAAEHLFARHGYEGTTLRTITLQAAVNLAAVNYHFGTKEALYEAVIARRMEPIDRLRVANLDRAELSVDAKLVPLAEVIEIMARPIFELGRDPIRPGGDAVRLIGRRLSEPLPFVEQRLAADFQAAMARFGQAIRRHLPGLTPEDFLWRFSFVVGAMHESLATIHRMGELTHGICRDNDFEGALRRFVQFAVAGLSPAAALEGRGSGPDAGAPT